MECDRPGAARPTSHSFRGTPRERRRWPAYRPLKARLPVSAPPGTVTNSAAGPRDSTISYWKAANEQCSAGSGQAPLFVPCIHDKRCKSIVLFQHVKEFHIHNIRRAHGCIEKPRAISSALWSARGQQRRRCWEKHEWRERQTRSRRSGVPACWEFRDVAVSLEKPPHRTPPRRAPLSLVKDKRTDKKVAPPHPALVDLVRLMARTTAQRARAEEEKLRE